MEQDVVRRLVLVRPAVEAGEKLGFLPGDLVQKVDPYLRPLYDALYEMLGFEKVSKLMKKFIMGHFVHYLLFRQLLIIIVTSACSLIS